MEPQDYETQYESSLPNSDDKQIAESTNLTSVDQVWPSSTDPNTLETSRLFEDLTLAEVLRQFLRSPMQTYKALISTAGTSQNPSVVKSVVSVVSVNQPAPLPAVAVQGETLAKTFNRKQMKLGLYLSSYIMAFWGCLILVNAETRYESKQLHQGAPFLVTGFLIWLFAEIYEDWPSIKEYWRGRRERQKAHSVPLSSHETNNPAVGWQGIHPLRVFAGIGVVIFSLMTWLDSTNNQFHFIGFWSWIISIILVIVTFAPVTWAPPQGLTIASDWITRFRKWNGFTVLALILIMLMASYFRLANLQEIPPEMTSDHIEKLLDSQRVVEGDRDIFFTNNGGREPFQMYAMALFSRLPGLGMDFTSLKLLAVVESLFTIPVLWWLGREIVGEKDPRLGNLLGLMLASLVAVSYWHVAITRLALRIVLTPLVASLLLIFLSRGIRHNRRGDFIWAGVVLGFGLYTYQAVRMLPIVIIAGVLLAIVFNLPRWAEIRRYIFHLGVLVAVSFVIFVPLFRFSVDYPEYFWMRTAGRLLGDEVIQETDAAGNLVERNATIEERLNAFQKNLGVLFSNIRNALLMYNWKGDVAWINGVPNYPVMDTFTGALLIVGLAAWLGLIFRSRDPVYLLVPVTVLIMLLPSALSIAAPIENPSATRASGSLPAAYLIAALPLALIALGIYRLFSGRGGRLASIGVVFIVVFGAFMVNADTYMKDYLESYRISWKSHSAPGRVLRGFAISDGAYGNAFMIHFPHWLDHRIVGLEGGILDWTNAIISVDQVPDFLNDSWRCVENKYRFEPALDILFFVNREDSEAERQLMEWFPNGRMVLFDAPNVNNVFKVYRVPALGFEGFRQWIDDHKVNPRCWTE